MIFEETAWVDNDSAKNIEALLFAAPHDLIKTQSPEHCQLTDTKKGIERPVGKRSGGFQPKAGNNPSNPTSNKSRITKQKEPVPIQKSVSVRNISTESHARINASFKGNGKKSQILSSKSPDKFHDSMPHSKDFADKSFKKSLHRNLQSEKDTPVIETLTSHKAERRTDHSMPTKSDWRKRAFSKLMQEGALPKSRPTKKSGNKKAGAMHDAKCRKMKQDGSATDSTCSVTSKLTDGMVNNPKRRKVGMDVCATNSIGPIESRSSALNRAVTTKLMAAQFRFINEQLYTRSSKEAKNLFAKDKKLFHLYHDGYSQQISRWPTNPLDSIISFIQKKPTNWVIGDFGCGDAKLARSVKNKVHSFDLVACNDRVTIADIAHVPLPNGSLDAVVLCLSLMGTNFVDFISEANRTLKLRGTLLIAEIESRFKNVLKFKNLMKNMGFQLKKEEKNSYFISFNLIKTRSPNKEFKTATGLLKPCVYKKR